MLFEMLRKITLLFTGSILLTIFSLSLDAAPGDISTIAGKGVYSDTGEGDGGPALDAGFGYPLGIDLDSQGNLYIVDYYAHRVRRVDAQTGIITTAIGTGSPGGTGDGGPASLATLYYPVDLAITADDSIYIAILLNHRIRKVNGDTGIITTVAGGGYDGDSDGIPALSAYLDRPRGVSVDTSGNMFITQDYYSRARKVDAATGYISTIAGDKIPGYTGDGGPSTEARINQAQKALPDDDGNIFIADTFNHRIRRIDAVTGIITTIAGTGTGGYSGDGGPAIDANLFHPTWMTFDHGGNLVFSDESNYRIRRIDRDTGIITTLAGNGLRGFAGDGGPATAASFVRAKGLAFDDDGNLFIADSGNQRIRRVEAAGPPSNRPPSADAGPDLSVEATRPSGADVTLSAAGSTDPDGDDLDYFWTWNDGEWHTVSGMSPTIALPFGVTQIQLIVDDGLLQATDFVTVTVEDTTAPVVTAELVPVSVNGRSGTFRVTFSAMDGADQAPVLTATLNGTTVNSGDVVRLVPGRNPRTIGETGIFQGDSFTLEATATDFSGNTGTANKFLDI